MATTIVAAADTPPLDPSTTSNATTTPTAEPDESTNQATPQPPARFPLDRMLVVARGSGLVALDVDGTFIRTLNANPGRSPRWLPDRKGLVYILRAKGRSYALEFVELPSGSSRTVAELPFSAPCPKESYAVPDEPDWFDVPLLDLHNEDELWVTDDGAHVCLIFSDHPADLRDHQRDVAIRLSDGRVKKKLVYGGTECSAKTSDETLKPCADVPSSGSTIDEPVESAVGGYIHSHSPDKKWQLVHLASVLGDVVHTQYVLYHPGSKKAYPLPQDGTKAWPKPFAVPTIEDPEAMIPGLPEIQGGSIIEWVHDHHLVMGQMLYIAGERIVPLEGDLAI